IQIFIKKSMQWAAKPLSAGEGDRFKARTIPVFAHSCYLINLATPKRRVRTKSVAGIAEEVEPATRVRVPFTVMHRGADLGGGEDAATRFDEWPEVRRRAASQRLEEAARLTRRSPRAHWQRADWCGWFPQRAARSALAGLADGPRNAEER